MEVARYQALYVADTIAHIGRDPDLIALQFERASRAINLNLPQQALSDVAELQLTRAQILGYNGAPLIQIAYQSKTGAPIALCIIAKADSNAQGPIQSSVMMGLASSSWETDNHQFLLIGNAPNQEMKLWAQKLRGVLQG